jgi:hypothetical protein
MLEADKITANASRAVEQSPTIRVDMAVSSRRFRPCNGTRSSRVRMKKAGYEVKCRFAANLIA